MGWKFFATKGYVRGKKGRGGCLIVFSRGCSCMVQGEKKGLSEKKGRKGC